MYASSQMYQHPLTSHGAHDQKKVDDSSDIKFLHNPPPPKTSRPSSTSSTGKHAKWTTSDLPAGAQDEDRWSMVFVPTLLRYQGCRHDPWNWDQVTSVAIVQNIWDEVYGDALPPKVQLNDSVHTVVRSFHY